MKQNKKIYHRLLSLRSRYGLTIAIFTIIICLLNVAQFFWMDDFFTYKAKNDMIKTAHDIAELDINDDSFFKDISNCEASHNVYVEIYSPKENLIYTTGNNDWIYKSGKGNSSDNKGELNPRIMKILNHKDINAYSYFETRQEFYAEAKYIVYGSSHESRAIELYYSVDAIEDSAQATSIIILLISFIIHVLIIALMLAYTYTFIVPLEKINSITKKITKMDFDETCPGFTIKELDELSSSVNALSSSLELTLRDLKSKNKRLETDIEKEHMLEERRKQFIANASHELKTPISIIQGYAEGIKCLFSDGDSPDEYCDIIIEESKKMNQLVLRLLEITQYENSGYKAKFEFFQISQLLESLISSRKRSISELGIDFQMDIDPSFTGYGDKNMLNDVFGNYISNAISHCSGQKLIKVSCYEHERVFTVSVFNTGETIANEDIEHIWDSFYRADKAHSRLHGRFGLGLSIAAAAQNIHKQKYGVTNHKDGVEFWFDISKYEIY